MVGLGGGFEVGGFIGLGGGGRLFFACTTLKTLESVAVYQNSKRTLDTALY